MTCILGSPTYCAVDVVSEPQARDFDAEFFCKDGWQASKACEARCQSSCGICDLAVHVYSTCAWYSSENTKSSNCCFTCRSCTWAMRRRIVEAMEQIYTTGAFSFFFSFLGQTTAAAGAEPASLCSAAGCLINH